MADSVVDVACSSCGARLVVPPTHRTTRCPYCDSPSVINRPVSADRPDPAFAIGFAVDRAKASLSFCDFLRRRRWAPAALRRATADRIEGVYLPAYLYSTIATSRYRAVIGENYTVTEYDSKNKRTRQVTKTEHRPLDGTHRCYVDDVVVTASSGISNDELAVVEPFDLADLRRFEPALISGWTAEEPTLSRDASLELARSEARAGVLGGMHAFMPGDSHHDLHATTELRDEAMDLVLLPLWVCAVRWRRDREPVRLLVNGQTGAVAGDVPVSWAKIAAVVGAGLTLIGLAVILGTLW